jgi:uncharacterized protein (DUF488 family)
MEPRAIYTIGYGKRELDEFIALLEEHEIDYLVDVRSVPYSRFRPEFSKAALDAAVGRRGIRYVFMGDLLGGRPEDPDCYVDGKVDYERVKGTERFRRGMERLRTAREKSLAVCLMCGEGRPEECHRSQLIGNVLESEGLPVRHIDADGRIRSQQDVSGVDRPGFVGELFP